MKKILIIFLVSITVNAFAQKKKKIKNKISSSEYEIYYVLKSDKKIKDGTYELYESNSLKTSGFYKENQKDSLWTDFKYSGEKITQGMYLNNQKIGVWTDYYSKDKKEFPIAQGEYLNGKRINVWNFNNNKGELIQQFDFNEMILTNVDTSEKRRQPSIFGGKYDGLVYLDKVAEYKSGQSEFFKFLAGNVRYPPEAKMNNIQGKVYVTFMISDSGETSNFKIIRGVHEILDKEALRVLKLTSGMWNSAIFEGEKVSSSYNVPINFILR